MSWEILRILCLFIYDKYKSKNLYFTKNYFICDNIYATAYCCKTKVFDMRFAKNILL